MRISALLLISLISTQVALAFPAAAVIAPRKMFCEIFSPQYSAVSVTELIQDQEGRYFVKTSYPGKQQDYVAVIPLHFTSDPDVSNATLSDEGNNIGVVLGWSARSAKIVSKSEEYVCMSARRL